MSRLLAVLGLYCINATKKNLNARDVDAKFESPTAPRRAPPNREKTNLGWMQERSKLRNRFSAVIGPYCTKLGLKNSKIAASEEVNNVSSGFLLQLWRNNKKLWRRNCFARRRRRREIAFFSEQTSGGGIHDPTVEGRWRMHPTAVGLLLILEMCRNARQEVPLCSLECSLLDADVSSVLTLFGMIE